MSRPQGLAVWEREAHHQLLACLGHPGHSEDEKVACPGSPSPPPHALPVLRQATAEFGVSNLQVATTSTAVMGWGQGPGTRMANGQRLSPGTFACVTTLQEQSSHGQLCFAASPTPGLSPRSSLKPRDLKDTLPLACQRPRVARVRMPRPAGAPVPWK